MKIKFNKITDICIFVNDLEITKEFYIDKLNFEIRREGEEFVDFYSDDITLAAWQKDHFKKSIKLNEKFCHNFSNNCIAIELKSPDDVDYYYNYLINNNVKFLNKPDNYEWNARCAYFYDPDKIIWELYSWLQGGVNKKHTIKIK